MSSKPSVSLSKVPSVKELCEHLGFQHATLKDTNNFMEATRAWRKSFNTTSGRPAATLLQWNDMEIQQDLEEMAEGFLDHENNGIRFWSPRRSWIQESNMRPNINFPENRAQIVSLLKQIFWRQNRYAKNNSHYAQAQKNAGMRDESREMTTPDRRTEGFGHSNTFLTETETKPTISRDTIKPENIPAKTAKKPPQAPRARDVFDGPNDEESDNEVVLISRTEPSGLKRPVPNDQSESPPAKKKYHLPTSPRRTPRKPIARDIPGKIPDDQVEDLLTMTDEETGFQRRPYGSKSLPSASKSKGEAPLNFKHPQNLAQSTERAGVSKAAATSSWRGKTAPTINFHTSDGRDGKLPRRRVISAHLLWRIHDQKRSVVSHAAPQNKETGSKQVRFSEAPTLSREKELAPQITKTLPKETGPACRKTTPKPELECQPQEPQPRAMKQPSFGSPKTYKRPSIQNVVDFEEPIPEKSKSLPKSLPKPPAQNSESELQETRPASQKIKPNSEPITHILEPTKEKAQPIPLNLEPLPLKTTPSQIEAPKEAEPLPTPTNFQPPPIIHQEHKPASHPQTSHPPTTSSKPRQKTLIPLWIITREPRSLERLWHEGKFMGTTLAAFVEGISSAIRRDDIEKIELTLRCPKSDTQLTVFKGDDDAWALAKGTFTEKVREAKAEARAKRQPDQPFKILIEPFYEEGSMVTGNIEDEEDDFEF